MFTRRGTPWCTPRNSREDSSYYRFVEFPGDVNFSALIPHPRFRNEPSGYLNARTLDKHWCLRPTWNGLYRGVLIYSAIGKWPQRRYQKVDIKIEGSDDRRIKPPRRQVWRRSEMWHRFAIHAKIFNNPEINSPLWRQRESWMTIKPLRVGCTLSPLIILFRDIYVQLVYTKATWHFFLVFCRSPVPRGRSRRTEGRARKSRGEPGEEQSRRNRRKRRKKRKKRRVNALATPCFKDCKRLLMLHRG